MLSAGTTTARLPRRSRRGLGLADAVLATMALSVLALYASQAAERWIETRLVDGEARALAQLARAGALLVEGDPAAWTPAAQRPEARTFAELQAAGLWAPEQTRTTPGFRRGMTLWLSLAAPGRVMVLARARGERIPRGLPGAGSGVDGVGALDSDPGATLLRGPDVSFDMAALNAFDPDFAVPGDMFALAHVHVRRDCAAYLHRVRVDGCPDAAVMQTDLDLNGNSLVGAALVQAAAVEVGEILGDVTVDGSVTVGAGLTVDVAGDTAVGSLTATAGLNVTGAAEVGALTVNGDVSAAGTVSAENLTFSGAIAVAGDAVAGDLSANELTAGGVVAGRLDAVTADYTSLVADTLTVQNLTVTDSCTGC